MAASEIREYENRVRFKNHLKRCQLLEAAREPPRPARCDEQVVDATTSDSDRASNDGIVFDHGSPDLSPGGRYESNANAVRLVDTPPHSDESDNLEERIPWERPAPLPASRRPRYLRQRRLTLPPPFSRTPRNMSGNDLGLRDHQESAHSVPRSRTLGQYVRELVPEPVLGDRDPSFAVYDEEQVEARRPRFLSLFSSSYPPASARRDRE